MVPPTHSKTNKPKTSLHKPPTPLRKLTNQNNRRIQMLAHPLRNAKKAKKAKIPFDNHAKPLGKNKKTKK
jgi:hypothetical protein